MKEKSLNQEKDLYDILPNDFSIDFFLNHNIYIWGTGHTGQLYLKGIERIDRFSIKGFCDRNASGEAFGKYKLYSINDVISDANAFVLICSWQKAVFDEIKAFLNIQGIPCRHIDEAIFNIYRNELLDNYYKLKDDKSRYVYRTLIRSRIRNTMPDFCIYTPNHYFSIPQCLRYGQEVFVNCGAYTGDTIERYLWKKTSFKKIYAFEPDNKSFLAMQKRIDRLKEEWNLGDEKIQLFNMGVAKKSDILRFSDSEGMGSMISPNGDAKVRTVALDDIIDEKVSLLIADIESYEYDMILGAQHIIRTDKPTLAICIYHNAMDFIQIQQLLTKLVPEYKFQIRHGSVTFDETVLFAYTDDSHGWIQ